MAIHVIRDFVKFLEAVLTSKPGSYPGVIQVYMEVVESAGQLDS